MKKLLPGTAALLALAAGPAIAADMPVKGPVYKAPVAVFSWTGFFVGGNLGYSWGNSSNNWNMFAPNTNGATNCFSAVGGGGNAFCVTATDKNKLNGILGGLQAGYKWQSGNLLVGVEADFQFSGEKGNQTLITTFSTGGTNTPGIVTAPYTEKLPWFGTLRGNVGFAVDTWLIYATGGLAYGNVKTAGSATTTTNGVCSGAGGVICPLANWSNSSTKTGWVIGAGVENAINRNWSWKLEYLHVDLGTVGTNFTTLTGLFGGVGGNGANIPAAPGTGTIRSRITDEIVRFGLNYKFGGPVVAGY